jgi:transcriptional/translational regulatory protein YebC/TACO1
VRSAFNKSGGNLGETGCVSYMFDRKGLIVVEGGQSSEDDHIELLMEFDLGDIKDEEVNLLVTTSPDGYADISKCIEEKGLNTLSNELTFIPQTLTSLEGKHALQCLKLIEALEDLDDTQNVFSNYDISDEVMEKISEEQ